MTASNLMVLFAVTVSLSACAPGSFKSAFDPAVPQIGYLKARVDALYQAEQAKDWRAWYLMTSPEIRESSSYEEFLREMAPRSFELISWRIRGIQSADDPEYPPGTHGAKVQMDIVTEEFGAPIERDTDQTDLWLFLDGEWYWVWRGWPND